MPLLPPPVATASHSRARLSALPLAGILVLALTGCGTTSAVTSMLNPAAARVYATTADAHGRLPSWIPADATGIRMKTSYRGDGSILEFRTATPTDRLGCTPAQGDSSEPAVRDTWWPDSSPAATMTCGDGWQTFAAGGMVYAWRAKGSPALDL